MGARMITFEEFGDFFAALHEGRRPYSWQEDLLKRLVTTGQWPQQIAAPTGSGKSAVVEVHVFANALAGCGAGKRVPRRLAVVVNRRALTDAHADRAAHVRDDLLRAQGDGVLARARQALESLGVSTADKDGPVVTATMRGAAAITTDWLNAPESCAVLSMTPAMWGSSILFRSYGATPFARPRLAGLLAVDAAVVLDESHLSRQLLVTARRVAELAVPSGQRLDVPTLQVTEMTATPSSEADDVITVDHVALARDKSLEARVRAAKKVAYIQTPSWPANGTMTKRYREVVVEQVVAQVESARTSLPSGPRTVGCVLNRVDSAIQVAKALRRYGLRVRLWTGRMRPWDLESVRQADPELFTVGGSDRVDVLVATQTVEVGVDLDLAALVTELASGSALAQRAGRVNRLARRDAGPVVIVGPPNDERITKDVMPYSAADLEEARSWVLARQEAGDLSPLAVSEHPPRAERARRLLWQRPERWDITLWARTSTRLFVEPPLELWLNDDLSEEIAPAGLVLRDLSSLPDSAAAESLITEVPPMDVEVYPVPLSAMRRYLSTLLESSAEDAVSTRDLLQRSVLWRQGAVFPQWQLLLTEGAERVSGALRPGDVIVLAPEVRARPQDVAIDEGTAVWEPVPDEKHPGVERVITDAMKLRALAGLEEDGIRAALGAQDVTLPATWEEETGPAWVVVRGGQELVEEDTYEFSAYSRSPLVLLERHNVDVSRRCRALAQSLCLPESVVRALAEAGRWHDVGKSDIRFQRFLHPRRSPDSDLVAKSGRPIRDIRRSWTQAGLVPGWRHELASAAAYWESPQAADRRPEERDIVTRLIGTSHGRGRPVFDHDPVTAGPNHSAALEELVGEGEWEDLIARTDAAWGPWGTAYLEALLRAADCMISAEGR